jgi:hypothetical protein
MFFPTLKGLRRGWSGEYIEGVNGENAVRVQIRVIRIIRTDPYLRAYPKWAPRQPGDLRRGITSGFKPNPSLERHSVRS